MSLHIHDDLEQGTADWLEARRGMVTASVVGKLITPSTIKPAANDDTRTLTRSLVAERITGLIEPVYVNDDMFRGQLCEPLARDRYAEHFGRPVTEVGFMVLDAGTWRLGFSPDGLVGDDGLLEVKAPRAKTHIATILSGEVPPYYMGQLQAGLLVSGRNWIDFVSYCGGLPMWTKRVLPDLRWHDAISQAVETFERTAERMVDDYLTKTVGLPSTERLASEEIAIPA